MNRYNCNLKVCNTKHKVDKVNVAQLLLYRLILSYHTYLLYLTPSESRIKQGSLSYFNPLSRAPASLAQGDCVLQIPIFQPTILHFETNNSGVISDRTD